MKIQTIPIHEIKPYENNAKIHPIKQLQSVMDSIREFGFRQPIVIDKNKTIVAGHARYEAASTLGLSDIPCEMADDLTEEQITAYRILDNKIAEMGYHDSDKLTIEITKLPELMLEKFNIDLPKLDSIPPIKIVEEEKKSNKCPACSYEW